MSNNDLFIQGNVFLNELAQLGHGAQCETDNYTSGGGCDCGLDSIKIKASQLVQDYTDALVD